MGRTRSAPYIAPEQICTGSAAVQVNAHGAQRTRHAGSTGEAAGTARRSNALLRRLCATYLSLAAAAPLFAHHGAGLFEPEATTTVTGTVTEFQFVNPHVLVYVAVPGDDGEETRWGGELTSPNRLARMDGEVKWHKTLLQPGDRITMTGHPARNGAPAMDITKIVDDRGVVLIGE